MKTAAKGLIIGSLGVGLLVGGSTFALWVDNADVDGGLITAGSLDVSPEGDAAWFDVSPDVDHGAGATRHSIDPATFLIVPGDTVEYNQALKLDLAGDNLKANLTIDVPTLTDVAGQPTFDSRLTGEYRVYLGDTATGTPIGTGATPLGNSLVVNDLTPASASTDDTYTVVITFNFDSGTEGQELVGVNAKALLDDLHVTLDQVRP